MKTVWKFGLKGARSVSHRRPLLHADRAILTINHGQDSNFNGTLVCLDFDSGEELWRFDHEHFFAQPVISSDGFVYVTSFSGHVLKFDMRGHLCWQAQPSEQNLWGGILSHDRFVYAEIAGQSKYSRAIDCQSGEVIWTFENGGHCYGLAARETAGCIIHSVSVSPKFGEWNYILYCTDAVTGALVWQQEYKHILFDPVILGDHVFVGSRNHVAIFDLNNGRFLDRYDLKAQGDVSQKPIIVDEKVIVASQHGHVAALVVEESRKGLLRRRKPDVTASWELDLSANIRSSVMGSEDTVLILTEDGMCHSLAGHDGTIDRTVKIPYFKDGYGLSQTPDGLLVAASRDCLRVKII